MTNVEAMRQQYQQRAARVRAYVLERLAAVSEVYIVELRDGLRALPGLEEIAFHHVRRVLVDMEGDGTLVSELRTGTSWVRRYYWLAPRSS